jgi:hypothetical protein
VALDEISETVGSLLIQVPGTGPDDIRSALHGARTSCASGDPEAVNAGDALEALVVRRFNHAFADPPLNVLFAPNAQRR